MYQIKIQGKPYSIPQSIDDISIKRLIKFRSIDPIDTLELIYWALDDRPMFSESNEIENEIANLLTLVQPSLDQMYAFMNDKSKRDLPKEIEVLGENIKLKGGLLNDLPYWAYVVTKKIVLDAVDKDNFDPTDEIPRVLAHYLYAYCTKKEYTERDAEEFIEIVNDIKMKEAVQLGNFFLSKHQSLFPSSKKRLNQKLIPST